MPLVRRFGKLLIANRGEIACRIIDTARRMQLKTVAVFSSADRDAMHVELADEALPIGSAPARDSYLRVDALLDAARRSNAEAVHPGYGFLAENADFAAACAEAGLVFIGPSADTIRRMGDKAAAKALMQAAGVPVVPGYAGHDQTAEAFATAAERIGYPVLVKAAAGGGGRGMRVVDKSQDLPEALSAAKREAAAAFGDDRLLLEKLIARPRHIEVQAFGDSHGNIVSLHERDCTLQRRYQKVVEEALATALSPRRREEMAAAARTAAQAVGYLGAGTVEFVAHADDFYFIEMNTRLQVEHPVTEMITGLDLVEWQLKVAFGEALPLRQEEIRARGHAVEARIYAEDAYKGFLPSTGVITAWHEPSGEGIRVDTGFRPGDKVTPYYDPLLAKLIAYGEDRAQSLARLVDALGAFEIAGVTTNLAFLELLMSHPQVASGQVDTGFIEREIGAFTLAGSSATPLDLAAACAAVLTREQEDCGATSPVSPWDRIDGWSLAGRRSRRLSFRYGAQRQDAVLWYERDGLMLEIDGLAQRFQFVACESGVIDVCLGDAPERVTVVWSDRGVALTTPRGHIELALIDPFEGRAAETAAASRIVAPMPGTITRILANPGTELSRGAPILVLEAMKMEHTLRAPFDGRLNAIKCAAGDFVQEGAELADFEPLSDAE